MQVSWYYNRYKGTYYNSRNADLYQIAGFSIKKSIVGAVVCAEVQIFRSYISAFVDAAYAVYDSSALQCALGEKLVSRQ